MVCGEAQGFGERLWYSVRVLDGFLHNVERLDVVELEAESLFAGEAHCKESEAVAVHYEHRIGLPVLRMDVCRFLKHGVCGIFRAPLNKLSDRVKDITMIAVEFLCHKDAVGESYCAVGVNEFCLHINILLSLSSNKRRSPEKPIVAVNFKGKRQEIPSQARPLRGALFF